MRETIDQPNKSTLVPLLLSRTILFFVFQALFALYFLLRGHPSPWDQSAGWWPYFAALTNLVSISLLVWLFHREGKNYFQFIRFDRNSVKKDFLLTLLIFAISAPLAVLPNIFLAKWLFGSSEAVMNLFFRPLPGWAAWIVLFLFPITIAFAELPTYFGYLMPRFFQLTGKKWMALVLPAFMLAFQHVTLPLLFDWRFFVWRLGMFIPFAFFLGYCIQKRPRLLPYLMIGHGLIDLSTVVMILTLPPA